jgi:hypothetical protein
MARVFLWLIQTDFWKQARSQTLQELPKAAIF